MHTYPCEVQITSTVDALRRRGVSLWPDPLDPARLEVLGKLSPSEIEWLRANKPAVLAYLRRRNADLLPPTEVCEAWRRQYANTHRGQPQ